MIAAGWIALAGSVGAVSRFVVDGHLRMRYDHTFPWATALINISGSLLLGIVTGLLVRDHDLGNIALLIGTGFCGGYTTFSTASFETVRLYERREFRHAMGNLVGILILSVIAAAVGYALACWL